MPKNKKKSKGKNQQKPKEVEPTPTQEEVKQEPVIGVPVDERISEKKDIKNEALEELKIDTKAAIKEEEKKAEEKNSKKPIKRRNSKFLMQDECPSPLLRPEFIYHNEDKAKKIWELMQTYQGVDQKSIQRSIVNHVEYTLAMTRFNFSDFGCYQATAFSIERVIY